MPLISPPMAKAKKGGGPKLPPDDIDLLNMHRFPELAPPSLLTYVRNSKVCQKRLQELLKNIPGQTSEMKAEMKFESQKGSPQESQPTTQNARDQKRPAGKAPGDSQESVPGKLKNILSKIRS